MIIAHSTFKQRVERGQRKIAKLEYRVRQFYKLNVVSLLNFILGIPLIFTLQSINYEQYVATKTARSLIPNRASRTRRKVQKTQVASSAVQE